MSKTTGESEPNGVTRDVVVIMPFRYGDKAAERHAILDLMRIKYITEHCVKVKPEGATPESVPISHSVREFRQPLGRIPGDAVNNRTN